MRISHYFPAHPSKAGFQDLLLRTFERQFQSIRLGLISLILLCPGLVTAKIYSFSGGAITINDLANASPYPSTVTVSGVQGQVVAVRLHLRGLSHTFPADLDVLLQGPSGAVAVVCSDGGMSFDLIGVDLSFSDAASILFPQSSGLSTGTYRPANHEGGDTYLEPVVTASSLTALGTGGTDGDWGLLVRDDSNSDVGSITSWELEIETIASAAGPAMGTARGNHSATLLPDGRLLVVGGSNGGTYFSSAEVYDPATGEWTSAGSIAGERAVHTATVLPNGKVLVAGGYNGTTALDTAHLFDPATGTWTPTDGLAVARYNHTATLLGNGTVLVVGGLGGGAGSAEIYDPDTGSWTSTPAVGANFFYHSATRLPDGRVLVAGGGDPVIATCRLYDPVAGTWSATGSLLTARRYHTATLLPDGKVLVSGGVGGGFLASAELYDPASGLWTATGSLAATRATATATLRPDGTVLVTGGIGPGALASMEIYHPAAGLWTTAGDLITARGYHTATLLPDARLCIAGGLNGAALDAVEFHDFSNPTWQATGSMPYAVDRHTASVLPNGKVMVIGGWSSKAQVFNPETGTWTLIDLAPDMFEVNGHSATWCSDGRLLVAGGNEPHGSKMVHFYNPATSLWSRGEDMPTERCLHTATLLPNGKLLVAGGLDGSGHLGSAALYEPTTGLWTGAGSLPNPRAYHTATLLPNGKVLVAGGVGGTVFVTAHLYDSFTGAWTNTSSMGVARFAHTATLLPNGKVLVVGGESSGSASLNSAELYDPATGTWSSTGSMVARRSYHTATLLPNGKVLVAGGFDRNTISYLNSSELYDPATGTWSSPQPLGGWRGQHTATLLSDGRVLVAGGDKDGSALNTARLYQPGLSFDPAWQPEIASATQGIDGRITVIGSGFRGISGASGGGVRDSSADYPLVQWRLLEGEHSTFLRPDADGAFTATSHASGPVAPYRGPALVTAFVNGIPSASRLVWSTASSIQDFDGDGMDDAAEMEGGKLGFNPFVNQAELVGVFGATATAAGYHDQTAYDANFTAGQDAVLNDPNTFDLYSLSQVQALNAPTPLLVRDPGTGTFTLTMDWKKSTNLTDFLDFPAPPSGVSVNPDGDIEFEFTSPDDAAFFRLEFE